MLDQYYFSSESVSPGHPDKLADQISDKILDDILSRDPFARVACETFIKTGMILVGGEISTQTAYDIDQLARAVVLDAGYTNTAFGFDGNTCAVLNVVGHQSTNITDSVIGRDPKTGYPLIDSYKAGDQGLMFGYACTDNSDFLPNPIYYANKLMQAHATCLKQKKLSWLRPDAKCQITFRYEKQIPIDISAIVFSTQHAPDISHAELSQQVIDTIIRPTIPAQFLTSKTQYLINPSGKFVIGGPMGDCGLTGRKIIADTYGGMARHGGGAFSGKDPSKVDRSAAYYARYAAKNLVAQGLAKQLEIQVAYSIGKSEPVSLFLNTFNTNQIPEAEIFQILTTQFDFRVPHILKTLDLLKPRYFKTACFGHFGRSEPEFTWEVLKKF